MPRCVAVPDVDRRALDRLAGRCVDDGRCGAQLDAGPALADVAANLLAVDVVGAFGLLGGEDAADEAGGDSGRPGARTFCRVGEGGLEAGGAERGDDEAAEAGDRVAPRQPLAV